mmetsp:Transcript_78625/g.136398  ORF Transcript_78625/g.136398 Transcript_78625/m.136398 type:complete len:110 (+) Transcript_78625:2-331(+)
MTTTTTTTTTTTSLSAECVDARDVEEIALARVELAQAHHKQAQDRRMATCKDDASKGDIILSASTPETPFTLVCLSMAAGSLITIYFMKLYQIGVGPASTQEARQPLLA